MSLQLVLVPPAVWALGEWLLPLPALPPDLHRREAGTRACWSFPLSCWSSPCLLSCHIQVFCLDWTVCTALPGVWGSRRLPVNIFGGEGRGRSIAPWRTSFPCFSVSFWVFLFLLYLLRLNFVDCVETAFLRDNLTFIFQESGSPKKRRSESHWEWQ